MCFINSISSDGEDRLDSRPLGRKGEFRGRLDIEAIDYLYSCNKGARLRQGTETLEATGRLQQVRVADPCRKSQQLTCAGSQ